MFRIQKMNGIVPAVEVSFGVDSDDLTGSSSGVPPLSGHTTNSSNTNPDSDQIIWDNFYISDVLHMLGVGNDCICTSDRFWNEYLSINHINFQNIEFNNTFSTQRRSGVSHHLRYNTNIKSEKSRGNKILVCLDKQKKWSPAKVGGTCLC